MLSKVRVESLICQILCRNTASFDIKLTGYGSAKTVHQRLLRGESKRDGPGSGQEHVLTFIIDAHELNHETRFFLSKNTPICRITTAKLDGGCENCKTLSQHIEHTMWTALQLQSLLFRAGLLNPFQLDEYTLLATSSSGAPLL